MKETTIESIANKLNISKSTVSRAIRHCGGVDSETRQRILSENTRKTLIPKSDCSIYAILPDIPQYFWSELRKGISEGIDMENAPIKYNIYTKLSDEETVMEYLDDAKKLGARVIILATRITPAIRQKLETLTEGRLILLLSEHHELTNSFYVGADNYRDGYIMGKQYLSHYADRQLVLCFINHLNNAGKRMDGFCQAVKEEKPHLLQNAYHLELDRDIFKERKLIPSKLATSLATIIKSSLPLCMYLPAGITQLPLALVKAKLTEQAVCLCHDCYTEHPYKGQNLGTDFAITCNQNMREQGFVAIKIATTFVKENLYPERKENFIESILNIET